MLKQLEEYKVQNIEEKEYIIMRDAELTTIIKQQGEDEAQKSMEKK